MAEPNQPPEDAGNQAGNFPRRRRRQVAPEPTPEEAPAPSPSPPEAAPPAPESASRPAEPAADEASPAPAAEPSPQVAGREEGPTAEVVASPIPEPPPAAPSPSTAPPAGAAPEEVPLGRKIIRAVLLLAVVGAGGYVLFGLASGDNGGAGALRQRIGGPPPAPTRDTSAADTLARNLMAKVDAGNLEPVLERAPALRREHEGHHGVQLALYKAETARAILNVAERLAQMERPEPENPDVPLPVNIARLEARMEYLNLLQGHYRDWREAILRIPAVRRVYEDYQEEIRQAPQQLVDWQAGYRFLQQAAAELQKPEPDFDLAMQFLRSAWGYLPLREILQTAQDAQNIAQARYMLDHRVVARAVEHLKAVDAEALKPPAAAEEGADDDGAAPETTTTLQTINSRLYEFWSQAKSKVGSWDELNTALAQARTDFREGRVDEALKTIKTALPKADPDNALTRDLAARLRRLQAHYREVQAAWRKALTVKAEKGLEEQLAAWAGFQGVLNRDDEYFQQALRQELLAIKETITGRIAERYRALRKAGEGYQSITLQMRKPQNPRQPFAEQARRLRAMALEAERIRNLAALVPNWDLGETTSAQVEEARSILGEHNDQARRLHNLYKLYHRLGKVELARESLQRVRLLGDVSSNPWYAEAVKTLEG